VKEASFNDGLGKIPLNGFNVCHSRANKMANAAAQRHQQLKNEANKMAMKIPFFHGDDKEDALDIKEMIRRFENSADAMGLADNAEK
jgi:hypothetical protein